MTEVINPECQQGKHANCDEVAYDESIDDLGPCECFCHKAKVTLAFDLADQEVRDKQFAEDLRQLRIIGLAYPVVQPTKFLGNIT